MIRNKVNFSQAKLGRKLIACKFFGVYFLRMLQSLFLCNVLKTKQLFAF